MIIYTRADVAGAGICSRCFGFTFRAAGAVQRAELLDWGKLCGGRSDGSESDVPPGAQRHRRPSDQQLPERSAPVVRETEAIALPQHTRNRSYTCSRTEMKVQRFSSNNKGGVHAASSDCFGESSWASLEETTSSTYMLIASNMTLEQARSFVPEIVNTISIGVEVCMCYDSIT